MRPTIFGAQELCAAALAETVGAFSLHLSTICRLFTAAPFAPIIFHFACVNFAWLFVLHLLGDGCMCCTETEAVNVYHAVSV